MQPKITNTRALKVGKVAMSTRKKTLLRNKSYKRRCTLIRKCEELRKVCGAQVYLLINLHGRLYIYESERSGTWPLTQTAIVSDNSPHVSKWLTDEQEQAYPLPVMHRPASDVVLEPIDANSEHLQGSYLEHVETVTSV